LSLAAPNSFCNAAIGFGSPENGLDESGLEVLRICAMQLKLTPDRATSLAAPD
jgi:hypothetical protein